MGFFTDVFCCCLVRDRSQFIDESSRLIPEPELTPPHVVVIDHQKMKERLGTIVRSKEGKMVNVNAHLPFDLYNQNPPSSSSRSASAQRYHATASNSHLDSRARKAHTPVRRSIAPNVNLGRPSQSRSQSSASASRNNSASRSSSSMYYNNNSIDFVDGDGDGTPPPPRHPTLDVKLVNRFEGGGVGSQFLRQGRPKSRFGQPHPGLRSGDDGEGEAAAAADTSLTSSHLTVYGGGGDGDVTPPRSFAAEEVRVPRGDKTGQSIDVLTPTPSHAVSEMVNGIPDIEFQDVGDISRSWGT